MSACRGLGGLATRACPPCAALKQQPGRLKAIHRPIGNQQQRRGGPAAAAGRARSGVSCRAAAAAPTAAEALPPRPSGAVEALLQHILVRRDTLDGTPTRRAPLDNQYLIGLVLQHREHLIIATVCLLLCTASNLAAPVLSGLLFETLVQQQPMERYAKVFMVLLAGYVLEPLLTKVYMQNAIALGEKVLATLRLELFRTLMMQKIEFFDRHSASELQGLLSVELDTMRSFVFSNCSRDRGLRAFLEAAGAILVLFWLSWRLAPVCSLVIVVTALAAGHYRKRTRPVEQAQGRALQQMGAVAHQAFENMRTVRSFAGEALERERFQSQAAASYAAGREFGRAKANFEATNRAAIHASLLMLYSWGGYLVSQGLMPISVLISGIGFTFSLMYATQGAVNTLSDLRRAAGAFERVRALIQTSDPDPSMYGALPPGAWWEVANGAEPVVEPYADKAGDAAVVSAKGGDLELRGVSFSYPLRADLPVLHDVNLILKRGTVTALVGRSGAGKSTVAALLSRFYLPQQGSILLDGVDAGSFTRGEWARAIAMVSQEPVLFSGTIADNISYGRFGKCSAAEIRAAAEAANAHEFISRLPDGYQTVVGERGTLLSGGQRQRIAIARALLKDSPVIILDEATSALDAVSEKLVQEAIQRLVSGRTVLVIAHRLSTVQAADQIVVMANGQIAERGTHEQLLAKGGPYSELMSSQGMILGSSI
ncbi:ABC transporter B family protein [Raphidocelis subcapitata]|uniref:ABC transporter B family protein n=1 Tax=Raphidocelis subcapitata TaxID=307507 RepID=A0A2V0NTJ6_9CHLO|nr:ABC transporter B family protein [Raphidocelis subcapitata]|eukprot:GBF88247.1 ABC transporter B family protein [Raphidocelis subcapitata]